MALSQCPRSVATAEATVKVVAVEAHPVPLAVVALRARLPMTQADLDPFRQTVTIPLALRLRQFSVLHQRAVILCEVGMGGRVDMHV